jgi:hypothetical protein
MNHNRKATFFTIVILISFLSMLVFPVSVLADDTTPPSTEAPEVLPPTEEPVTESAVVEATPDAPPETLEAGTEEPTAGEAATDVPAIDQGNEAGESEDIDLSEIVLAAAENNVTLADPSGEPLQLVTVEAAESLAAGDPYFTSGGVLYRFLPPGGCAAYGGVSATCTESSTPIQAALTFSETNIPDLLIAPDGTLRRTIYVEPATYNEQLTINTANLTLWGDPGSLTVAGAAASAPVLDGSTWVKGDTGVTITAEGVTLIGFIIQNYETAVSQPVVVGSNAVVITQNTIQNNGEGIVILSDVGSPGTDVTYNIFQDNSSFDLVNGDPNDNNVQFVDAPNNYWGCSTGPVVAYRIFEKVKGVDVWTGEWGYIDWATKHNYGINGDGDDPDPACALLYGSDSLFDFQINTSDYSPYKINIGSFIIQIDAPALSLEKSASPGTYDSVGDVISYSYLVTNTGNVNFGGPITVTDDKATVTCPPGGLAPNESMTCSASYVITQADLDSGSVTNTAQASANGTDSNQDSATVTAVQSPALSIAKSATPTTYSALGQVINYSYLVTNTGNVTLSGPFVVSDDKSTDENCPITLSLAPGESITCTASYTITQADLDAGSVTNIASATNGAVTSPTDTETVTAVQGSALSIVKTANPTTYSTVGQVIDYSYLVTNTGNVTLSGPFTVSDDKATVSCPPGDLTPGASLTCAASYVITQADLDSGSVTNIAFATNGTVTSPPDTETVTALQNPAMTIVKTASPATYSTAGQVIDYSYLVTNTGNVTIGGPITVTDDKAIVSCPPGDLAPGGSMTCTASYVITQADLNAGSVTNIAFASNGTVTSPTDTETVTAVQGSALSIVKTASPSTYSAVSQVINYSYLVTNTGNVTLSGPFTVTDDKATVTCPPGDLDPGASLTCTASYTITQADLDAGLVTNTAFATNGTVTSPSDSETVTAVQNPALTIAKSASPGTYDSAGEVISYSYLVTNTGNVTFVGPVTVSDDKATVTCPPGGLAPGASMTCNASYNITQADLDAGSVTNIARASANGTDSNEDTETVTANQNPGLSLVKTATPTTYSTAGQVIGYSYLITNTGNVTLDGPFSVTDDKAAVTCPVAASLAPGASITCTASYIITQADLDSGSVTNVARAYSANETESNEDSETVTAVQNPALTTLKTETSEGPYAAGDTITYDIVVTNTGNVTLTGVTVTDDSASLGACVPAQPATLAPGASMTCSASHAVTSEDVDNGRYVNTAAGDSDQTAPITSSVTVDFTPDNPPPPPPPGPQPTPTPDRPSVSFTGFIPVTGGETHAIAAGIAHTCAIMPEGGVKCWGNNDFGQLGDGTNTGSNVPVDVVNLGGGTTIVAGGNHTCVLTGGEVWCWGQNTKGQLGDGTRTNRNIPVKVIGGAVDITAGLDYTCAVMIYGQVLCWGNNDQGQLADGTRTDRTTPTLAALISSITNVDAGRNQSCGLTSAGLLRCLTNGNTQDLGGMIPVTGQSPEISLDVAVNRFGNLVMSLTGNGVPVKYQAGRFEAITDVTRAIDVDSGLGHVCALVADGTVSCWGSNFYGQLGRNTKVSSQVPQFVLNISSAWQLAVGRNHACVLISSSAPGSSEIQCWGLNTDGQLGDGTYVNSPVPVFVK